MRPCSGIWPDTNIPEFSSGPQVGSPIERQIRRIRVISVRPVICSSQSDAEHCFDLRPAMP
eukprot:7819660-Alexandrium_andersonii.AAC.1